MTRDQRTALEQLEQDVPETIASRLRSILSLPEPDHTALERRAERLVALLEEREMAETTCTDCPRCGVPARTSDLRSWLVCEQTHREPAEYDDGCIYCCPKETR
jgi:hypothetical protein